MGFKIGEKVVCTNDVFDTTDPNFFRLEGLYFYPFTFPNSFRHGRTLLRLFRLCLRTFRIEKKSPSDQQPNCFRLIFSRNKFGRVGSFLQLFWTFQNSCKELPTRPNFSRIFASSSELPDLLRQSSDYHNSEEIRKKFVYVKPGHYLQLIYYV